MDRQPKIEIVEPRLFAGVVADEIIASIEDVLREKPECNLALAGGATPSRIYRALSTPPRSESFDWGKVNLFWGDERWVPNTDQHSNYHMVAETLLANLSETKPKVFPVDTTLASPEDAAKAYEQQITKTVRGNFDLVLLGVGEDGHTASVFPKTALLRENKALVAAANSPQDGGRRVTLTPKTLFDAAKIIFIVSGESKQEVVKNIFSKNCTIEDCPAKLYESAKGKVIWFLDSLSARHVA